MEFGDGISIVALIVSLVAAWFAWHQQQASFRLAWYEQVVTWARECVRTFSGAHELLSITASDAEEVNKRKLILMESFSSLIDEGRFIFENDKTAELGASKPYAYIGIRPDVLDYLVGAYISLKEFDAQNVIDRERTRNYIIDLKRHFVSDVVQVIEPNWFSRRAKTTPKNSKITRI
ncbi:hypothetical protein [Hansschlegelia zhihuaiae]|uniref:DUF4760 domain-containing protein n=1 Tax=Hansschlegelia zhihuaiae TaxID=405005 RepID=A0A4Q0MMI9_9HYPH|nr:hypothetical protein [Hansschlegelia zhihuaiae]RXF74299.1 hypothetical protein EK403_05575 [Hansschlegelia zhihuaiae]